MQDIVNIMSAYKSVETLYNTHDFRKYVYILSKHASLDL